MFWPDEDLDNEWLDHFIVSYDKEQEIEIICIVHLTFLFQSLNQIKIYHNKQNMMTVDNVLISKFSLNSTQDKISNTIALEKLNTISSI